MSSSTQEWIKLNLPELNEGQITQLTHYIAEREREARKEELNEANTWSLTSEINRASWHKWAAYHAQRLTTLTQQTIKEREE